MRLGRKAIAFDLNPLSSFIIEVTASGLDFDETLFKNTARRLVDSIEQSDLYVRQFTRQRRDGLATILNYRWEDGNLVGVAIEEPNGKRRLLAADRDDVRITRSLKRRRAGPWHPTDRFPAHPSVTHRFLSAAGGETIDFLWTRRNLYLLAAIFEQITEMDRSPLRLQLLAAFIQSLHLCTKMVIPRHEEANRDYSGSWGRPDFLIRRRQMEQNPVDVFWRSCAGRQGVLPMLRNAQSMFPDGISIHDARAAKKIRESADINYGAIDISDLADYVKSGSIPFVITDPPYAGLIRYLPLSVVWLSWLEHVDRKYKPDLRAEIKVERGSPQSRNHYRRRLRQAFGEIHGALANDGRLVVTFHHQEVREFNDFAQAVRQAGFVFDKVTHQYNRRSGESNVANPYGVSGSDFYIRCVKRRDINFTADPSGLENFIVQKAIQIVGQRNEPTPYGFLFEGLWPELLQAGYAQPKDSDDEIQRVLNANAGPGKLFERTKNPDKRTGEFLWWLNEPAKHINHRDRPLGDRVAESVLAHLRRKGATKLDDVVAELFREYPNGLTPDPRTVVSYLEQFAFRSQGKWKISQETAISATRHSDTIGDILRVGSRMRVRRYVGLREQHEQTSDGEILRDLADLRSLSSLSGTFERPAIDRLEMVDAVFLRRDSAEIICLWEVENSTNFSTAILRGSNAPAGIPKFMVVPDDRVDELLGITDRLFPEIFAANGWRYLNYSTVSRLASFSEPTLPELLKASKDISR